MKRMKTKMQKIAWTFLTVALLAAEVIFPATSFTVRAETTAYERTAIEDDLNGLDITAYPKNEKGTVSLVNFSEYSYSNNTFYAENYGLYFYIYNPTEKEISTRAGANVINMAVSYNRAGEPSEYANMSLTVLDSTENRRFYKLRLTNVGALYETEKQYSDGHVGERRYDIAGIQLYFIGEANARDFKIAGTYRYTGYAKGMGGNSSEASTLNCEVSKLEVVPLTIYQTYFHSGMNENGAGHQNQLTSVYFAIPKDKIRNYGGLYAVKCSWNERRTTPIIVTKDMEVFNDVSENIGTRGEGGRYRIYDNYFETSGMGNATSANWAYNGGDVLIVKDILPVGYAFKSNKSNVRDEEISTETMLKWIREHGEADYLFSDDVDEGRTYGYQEHTFYADELFDMLSFDTTADGFKKFAMQWQNFWSFLGGESWDLGEDITDIAPIKPVTDEDFKGTESVNAKQLLVNENDYGAFKSFYDMHKSVNDIFLLRVAVTDYYSRMQRVEKTEHGLFDGVETESTFMARETVFMDFDIIELTFQKDGKETVLGVVASPVDLVGGITGPIDEGTQWWVWVIIAIVALVVIVLLCVFVKPFASLIVSVFKGLWWLITLPFRAIKALIYRKK